jgi:hypothetical protein
MRNVALAAAVCCGLMTLSSCSSKPAAPEEWVEEGGEADADPQALARAKALQAQILSAKVEVVQLREFPGTLSLRKMSGPVDVEVQFCGVKSDGVAETQRAAIREFVANEKTIFRSVREAIYEDYRKNYFPQRDQIRKFAGITAAANGMNAADAGNDIDKFMPEIKRGDELDNLVTLQGIYVHRPVNGVAKIGIEFNCRWSANIGVRLAGTTIDAIGDVYEALPQ